MGMILHLHFFIFSTFLNAFVQCVGCFFVVTLLYKCALLSYFVEVNGYI